MLLDVVSTVDRYAGAHQHFSSSGFDVKKIVTLVVIAGVVAALVFIAYKNK